MRMKEIANGFRVSKDDENEGNICSDLLVDTKCLRNGYKNTHLHWSSFESRGGTKAINFSPESRPRRQDFKGEEHTEEVFSLFHNFVISIVRYFIFFK